MLEVLGQFVKKLTMVGVYKTQTPIRQNPL